MPTCPVELLASPFEAHFDRLLDARETELVLCAPYVSRGPLLRLVDSLAARGGSGTGLHLMTDLSARHLLSGSTDVQALADTVEVLDQAKVTYVPRIHAKVYVAGTSLAIVGSANFTDAGSRGNLEYGLLLRDTGAIKQVRADLERYAALGGPVPAPALRRLADHVAQLRKAVQDAQDAADARLRRVARELQRETEDDLIRLHVAGRSPHGVFAQGVLYLLSFGAMTTQQLHERLQLIYPDLCDDSLDRVIDGQHFGKLWKHQVRTAQQHLKRTGSVSYDAETRQWSLVT